MAKQPEGKPPQGTNAQPSKPAVKGETFKQVPNDDKVKGGRMASDPKTSNATKTDAYCCGDSLI